jgi:hypothetical protein
MTVNINGIELTAITVGGSTMHYQGAQRNTLTFQFPDTYSFEQLEAAFTPLNTARIELTDEDGTYLYDNYTMRVSMAYAPYCVSEETDTEPAVFENRYTVVMAQKTYSELQIESLQDTVDILVLEILGV